MDVQSEFLWRASLGDIVGLKPALVWVEPTTPLTSVCNELRLHNYLSVPVYDTKTHGWVGIANVLDIALFIVWGSVELKHRAPAHPSEEAEKTAVMTETELEPRLQFAGRPISDVLISDEARNFCVFDANDSLQSIMEPFSKGYHRALVRLKPGSASAEDYRLVTQTDIVRFLFTHRERLQPALLSSTVENAGLVNRKKHILCATNEEGLTVVEAFRRMTQKDMSCIGICDPHSGRLQFNLSASDLRGITPESMKLLLLSPQSFLTAMYGETLCHKMYPVTCAPDATLAKVMELILSHKVHRIWVVNASEQPVGLVSLSDILYLFSPFPEFFPKFFSK